GIGDYIDILSRNNEQREQAYMIVAKGRNAYEVMGVNSGMAQSPGRYIHEIISHEVFNEETRTLTISEFFRYYFIPHEDYIMGVLDILQKPQINESIRETQFKVLSIGGGSAFKND